MCSCVRSCVCVCVRVQILCIVYIYVICLVTVFQFLALLLALSSLLLLGLGLGIHDGFYYFGNDSNGSIEEMFVFVAEVVEPTGLTSSFGGNEISCVTVGGKDHIACSVELGGILVAGAVVEEVGNCFDCGMRTVVGHGSEVVECMHHGIINGSCILEKISGHLHEKLLLGFGHVGRSIDLGELLFCTVLGNVVFRGGSAE